MNKSKTEYKTKPMSTKNKDIMIRINAAHKDEGSAEKRRLSEQMQTITRKWKLKNNKIINQMK